MRRELQVLCVVASAGLVLALSGCVGMDPGDPVTEEFDAAGVEEIVLAAPGELVVVNGDAETLVMDTGENVAEAIDITVDGGVMLIEMDEQVFGVRGPLDLDFVLEVPSIVSAKVEGSGSIEGGDFETDELELAVSGSGEITIDDLDCEGIVSEIDGSGRMRVSGIAQAQSVSVSGSGENDAEDLETESATVQVDGSGSAIVWASDELEAGVAGSGSIEYYGEPQVRSSDVDGSGNIDSRGAK